MNFLYRFFNKYNRYVRLILLVILVIFFLNLVNQEKFIFNLKEINYFYLIPIFLTLLLLPILITYRWFLIVKSEVKDNFKEFYNNIIQGYVVGSVTMFSFAIDIYKFVYIQKYISKKKSLFLIILDKLLSIYFKVIFLLFFFLILNLYLINFYTFTTSIIIITLILFLFFLIILIKKILKFKNFNFLKINVYQNYIIDSLDIVSNNYFRLFLTNILIQSITVSSYFAIAVIIGVNENSILVALIAPVIETITQLQFLSFGFRELVSVGLLKFVNISFEKSLIISLIFTLLTTLVTIFSNVYCIIVKNR